MISQQTMLVVVLLLPFAGSCVAALFRSNARNVEAWFAAAVALAAFVIVAMLYPAVDDGAVIRLQWAWMPSLGLDFVLRLDGFSWLFAMLVLGIGLLVVLYARYYMSPEDPVPRFFAFLLAFMGAMLGIVLSGNLIQLVFFWELTSLFSFLLISYWYHSGAARDGARMALILTGGGGLCLFAGVLILGHVVGSYDLDVVLASGDAIRSSPLYLPILLLVLCGALTKSAQFPFHFWLPQAMVAPTPVSAYLHSAALVKAGVFLLVRLWPVLGGTDEWLWIVGTAGLVTFVLGAYLATFEQDLKGLLAYSTISHIGLITLLLGLDNPLALVAGIFHIINHATFKASLFMGAGIIEHESGTRDIRRLSGLRHFMPMTATLAMVAAAAMAGVPLLNGFLSKEMFFAETIEHHSGSLMDTLLPYIATLAGAFSVAYSLRFIHSVFFGPPATDLPGTPREPPRWMRFPVELLVLACLVVGIIPALTVGPFLNTAVRAVLGPATPTYSLMVWHGLNPPLLMSMIALTVGAVLYTMLYRYFRLDGEGAPLWYRLRTLQIFDWVLRTVSWRGASTLEDLLGTRYLQPQLRLLVGVALIAAAWPVYEYGLAPGRLSPADLDPAFGVLWVVGIGCAIGAASLAKFHRLIALILLGGVGLSTCITFVWLSAPDLALTQLLVEIVTTILLLLGLRWLPPRHRNPETDASDGPGARARRLRDAVLALVAGTGLAAFTYAVVTRPAPDSISRYFVQHALPDGGGHNIVNVILVDFRGFDTLGEITVLGVVGLAVFALLRRFRPAPESVARPKQQRVRDGADAGNDRYPVVPGTLMQWLFPFIALMAPFLFLRGHDLPGGGFVAGITMTIAFILLYMTGGVRWMEARLRLHPLRWIAAGLLCAVATGVGAWVVRYPFLSSHAMHVDVPVIGTVPVASAILFDLGVFVLVVGAMSLVLVALAHQSLRSERMPQADAPPDSRKDQEA